MIDYQWPHATHPHVKVRSISPSRGKIEAIEKFFSDRFGHETILVPSGRAGLAMVLRFLKINRSHAVFAPMFSSFCLWDVIGRVANPVSDLGSRADVVIAVHKWGQTHGLKNRRRQGWIIEDSVDTLFQNGNALFPLGGICEIVSLPKTIGSYCGGLVLSRDPRLLEFVRQERSRNKKLAQHQSRLKLSLVQGRGNSFEHWSHLEATNSGFDETAVEGIAKCLPNWDRNAECIQNRLYQAKRKFGKIHYKPESGRLPPVLPFRFRGGRRPPQTVMVRNYSFSRWLDVPKYERAVLLPLHFGVSDRSFEALAQKIERMS